MHVNYVLLNVRFFPWFDAIAVFETGKNLTDKVYWGKECLHGLNILWRLTAVGKYERVIVFSLEVILERVLALKWNCQKRGREFEDEVFIENTCLEVGYPPQKKRGTKFKWGRSFKRWSRGSPGQWFPETEYMRASAIFVSGTGGIPPILNYRSVSPIDINTYLWFVRHLHIFRHYWPPT